MTVPVRARRPELKLHQREAAHACAAKLEAGFRRQLFAIATGGGKTVLFSSLPRALRRLTGRRFRRMLVIAHRSELLTQAKDKMEWCEAKATVVFHSRPLRFALDKVDVVIASVQALGKPEHLALYPTNAFDIIVIDEAHHAVADSMYAKVVEYFRAGLPDGPLLLGFTATPMRTDGRSLRVLFDVMTYAKTLEDGMREGWLAPCRYLREPIHGDLLSAVEGKYFDTNKLAGLMDQERVTYTMLARYKQVREELVRTTGQRPKTIVFAVSVQHAKNLTKAFLEFGFEAQYVDGELAAGERARRIAAFARHEFEVLCSVNLLLEGFDDPGITVAVDCKPTRSLVLATQEFGRILRQHPGKTEALYIQAVPEHADEAGMIQVPGLFGLELAWNDATTELVASTPLHEVSERLADAAEAAEAFRFLDVSGDAADPAVPLTAEARDALIAAALARTPEAIVHLVGNMPETFRRSDVLWHARPDHSVAVQVPDQGTLLVRPPDLLGTTIVEFHHAYGTDQVGAADNVDAGRRLAERWLAQRYPELGRLLFRSQAAKWMEKSATPAQCAELDRLLPTVPAVRFERMRRGMAHALLTYLRRRPTVAVAAA
jgi:superfamily II DNA or RNA helicase